MDLVVIENVRFDWNNGGLRTNTETMAPYANPFRWIGTLKHDTITFNEPPMDWHWLLSFASATQLHLQMPLQLQQRPPNARVSSSSTRLQMAAASESKRRAVVTGLGVISS
jgi:hypothetical protein